MSSNRTSRRAVLVSCAAVTGALLLSACGSDSGDDSESGSGEGKAAAATTRQITDAQGRKVKVPGDPRKVVTLSEPTTDAALALGVEPVGVTAGRGQKGVSTYLADKASKAQVVATVAEADMEKLAALQPDLILLDETTGAKKTVDKLQEIAPTVVTAKLNEDWKKSFTDTADALNKKADAEKWLTGFDTRVADVKKQLGSNAGTSVSVIRWQDGAPSVVGKGDGVVASTLQALGTTRPKDQQGASTGHSEPVSLEKLDTIDGDWLFFGTLGDKADGEKAYGEAQKVTNFGKLTAEKDKHVVVIEGSAWNSAGGPLSAQVVLDDLEGALAK
ncbi:ABC transporter substrate-binding protein [Streptomyces kunmingensis]|uniref:ABC transporter substrate-binding protein n=1 Tax=Streptomyces kunmingensis TaxID=68225 RepID=A0ABU6CEJ4_9ACTN|nr:ABC transporter substrate-binding protein [Streptomyces kunmingensis]MEB3962805.1 ABC transporter substrate-binding protein [Streptomyces kunmingensis]